MTWLAQETWLLVCLAGLLGFTVAWLWQRRSFVPRLQVLSEELALCRRRSAEIENERKQAVAQLARSQGAADAAGDGIGVANVAELAVRRRISEAR